MCKTDMSRLVHTLWTKDVGTPDYDKSQWMKLSVWVERAERDIESAKCSHYFQDTKHCIKCGWVPEKKLSDA